MVFFICRFATLIHMSMTDSEDNAMINTKERSATDLQVWKIMCIYSAERHTRRQRDKSTYQMTAKVVACIIAADVESIAAKEI